MINDKISIFTDQIAFASGMENGSGKDGGGSTTASSKRTSCSISSHDQKQYWLARARLRIWPVKGEVREELWQGLEDFVTKKLRMPERDISEEDVVDVKRLRERRGQGQRDELLVVFADVETRDRYASYARNLSEWVDNENKPTAGVRHDVPSFLGGVFKALMQYGHAMKRKYGADFKRNVRFEDAELTMCIDVRFPYEDEWTSVGYERVLEDRRANRETGNDKLSSKIERGGAEAEEEPGEELGSTPGAAGRGGKRGFNRWSAKM